MFHGQTLKSATSDYDQRHVIAFRPISVAAHSWSNDNCDYVEQALLEKTKQWENVVECIRVINVNIRDLQLEIKRAVDEFTGDYYYVLVCCLVISLLFY